LIAADGSVASARAISANSLFFEKDSLLGLEKFPVPLRREFIWKPLNQLND
jgi:hypothetical protein